MPFKFKTKEEFLSLDKDKRCYYLARLYMRKDESDLWQKIPYKNRLFTCVGYLKKQQEPLLSVIYNYLTDHNHNGLMIWDITPKAVLYDEQRRRVKTDAKYEDFNKEMLEEILGE